MNAHHELNVKDIEITTLKLQNEQLQSDLKREKEFAENFNKPNETIKYFEQLLRSPRSNNDTSRLDIQVLKKESHPKVLKKGIAMVRTTNLLVIIVVRYVIQQMFALERLQIRMLSIRA